MRFSTLIKTTNINKLLVFLYVYVIFSYMRIIKNRNGKIHNFFILLSVLGGLALFGPVGFIAGPLVLSLFFALLVD